MQFKGHSQTSAAGRAPGLKWLLAAFSLVILTGLVTVTAHAAQPCINNVDVKNLGGVVQITVSSDSALSIHDSRLGDRYLVFDMYGKLSAREQKRVNIDAGGIRSIRCGWYQDTPPIARIAVGTSGVRDYSVSATHGQRLTTIKIRKQGPAPMPACTQPSAKADKPVPGGGEHPVLVAADPPVLVAQAKPESKPGKLVSLDFVASDIHDVLKALSLQGGVNIVAGPDVKGNVTVSLTRVTVDEALKLVANVSGFKYQLIEGSYVIGTDANIRAMSASSADPEDAATEVVTISYADPAMVSKMIEAQFPSIKATSNAGAAKDVKGPVVLVLTGSKSMVESAKNLAETIEQSVGQSAQDMVTELYEVKYAKSSELIALVASAVPGLLISAGPTQGFNLECPTAVAMGAADTTAAGPTNTPSADEKPEPRFVLLQGGSIEVETAKKLLTQLDAPVPQLVIEAKVVDISSTGADQLGIIWGDKGTLSGTRFDETPGADALSIGRFDRLVALQIPATIKGLVESGKAKVLANPNVAALDSKPSSIFIGDEVKYVVRIDQTLQGGTTILTDTARVGVQLHTISRVNSDGFITMDLHPEVSVITQWIDMPGGDISLPQISRRYIDSTVRVKDGETIVIGGLIKDEEIKSMGGVPFLKDLPFIGQLFKNRSTTNSHSEIMMFITPRVLTDSK
jgi:type II secretory pathway component GspD/PulD (secretin)